MLDQNHPPHPATGFPKSKSLNGKFIHVMYSLYILDEYIEIY